MPSKSLVWGKSNVVQMLQIFITLSSTKEKIACTGKSFQDNKHHVPCSGLWITTSITKQAASCVTGISQSHASRFKLLWVIQTPSLVPKSCTCTVQSPCSFLESSFYQPAIRLSTLCLFAMKMLISCSLLLLSIPFLCRNSMCQDVR